MAQVRYLLNQETPILLQVVLPGLHPSDVDRHFLNF